MVGGWSAGLRFVAIAGNVYRQPWQHIGPVGTPVVAVLRVVCKAVKEMCAPWGSPASNFRRYAGEKRPASRVRAVWKEKT